MYFLPLIYQCFLIISLLMTIASHGYDQTLAFSNSDKLVTINNGKLNDVDVLVNNRIIVKADQKLSKRKIASFHVEITDVTPIYQGKNFTFYLIKISSVSLLSQVIQTLSGQFGIQLVQPDLLQLIHKNSADSSKPLGTVFPPYINMYHIKKLWQTTKGAGVKIAIIDDGFALSHPEFNVLKVDFSYDVSQKKLSSLPVLALDTHGTKVAGVIFAQHDAQGIEGIAPEASFIAIRQPDTWTSNTLLSFQVAKLAGADVINCSWHSSYLLQPIKDVIDDLSFHGRNGKGIAVVISAGNNNQIITSGSSEAAIASAIVVGAVDELTNKKLNFSNYGQSVDLMIYAKAVKSTIVGGGYGTFSGTSLSAAIVSGLAALAIAEQPQIKLNQLVDKLIQLQHN
ncbi:MAG: S8 family serine peptidase [Gammaproteobacteria bacterium]|nr:S8 family serine peptidase [Gammaproteobacteria bacterium]